MAQEKLLELLRRVQEGTVSPEQAVLELKVSPFQPKVFSLPCGSLILAFYYF